MTAVALHQPEPQQRREVAKLPSVGAGFFDLHSFELMQRVARGFTASSLVPKIYQGTSSPEALGNCMIALNLAKRMNADPLMVMQNLTIIQGRPSWSSQFLIATVNTCGRFTALRFEFFGERGTDQFGCRAWAMEKATGEKLVGADITIDLAKAEGWFGRSGSKWKTMAQQMLIYRAGAWWTRAYAPELSMGLLTADEVEDIIDLEPSAYRDVTPARGRPRSRAAAANDSAPVDVPAEEDDQPFEVPAAITPEQVAELTALANAAGANIDKFCEWLGVASFEYIPATQFDKAKRALETKRRQADQSKSNPGPVIPPAAAETPAASLPAGTPASSDPMQDDAGNPPEEPETTEKFSPMEEARQAGRGACEAGVDFKDVPEKYRVNAYWRKAWKEGYQERAEEMGA